MHTHHISLPTQDLSQKVALITGASRGIGRAIAINLAKRGCSILGTCSKPSSLTQIEELEAEIAGLRKDAFESVKIKGIVADIFSPDCATTITNSLKEHFDGHLDIFVNNAADSRDGELGSLTDAEIQHSLTANIATPVLIVEELVKRQMFRENSRIVYISSVRSRLPWSRQLMYSAGKAAGEALCRTWSQAFGGREEKVLFFQFGVC